MLNFYQWLESNQDLSVQPGQRAINYAHMSLQDRLARGREITEPFMIEQLKKYGIDIIPSNLEQDKKDKIDGFWDNKPVQLKERNSGKSGRNDVAYEVCRNHDTSIKLQDQLKNPKQQGRDFIGKAAVYFVMDNARTNIAMIESIRLKVAVLQAIKELNNSSRDGVLGNKIFQSQHGIVLNPTKDRDPLSFTPNKVMAFIPIDLVVSKNFPVQ